MDKLIVKSPYLNEIKNQFVEGRMTDDLKDWCEQELYYLECNHKDAKYLLDLKKKLAGKRAKNPNNSTVAYLMGLTDEKPSLPIRKTLGSLPDIDYDSSNRDAIKKYVVEKHGVEKTGLIGTVQTLAVKGALKDTVRQFGEGKITPDEANQVTKALDVVKAKDFDGEEDSDRAYVEGAIKNSKFLEDWFGRWAKIKEVLLKMVGTVKSTGIHASGIVISDKAITSVCPAVYSKTEGLYVTQPQMGDVEWLGLIKFDFLGLKTLEIFKMCFDLVKSRHGVQLSTSTIPLDNERVYDALSRGDTAAVFQFEGEGITEAIKMIKPSNIFDMSAINALYRPGPMAEIPKFAARKNGQEKVTYSHPIIESVLAETYGVLVYQEQIMELAIHLGGLTGSEGYALIKAISKKDAKKIESYRERFCAGAKSKKLDEKNIEELWKNIMKFAEYGFNKSHAVAYAITGYICAWLKLHYRQEFIASVLSICDSEDFEYLYPLWKKDLLTPSVRYSTDRYEIIGDKIAMPFNKIASLGDVAPAAIIKNRPYDSFMDFLAKNENEKINKTVVKNLIFSGAFDDFREEEKDTYAHRLELFEQYICFNHGIDPRTKEERQAGVTLASRKKKPSKALLEAQDELDRIKGEGKGALVNLEIGLLGFSTFNYYEFFGEIGKTRAKNTYGDKLPYVSLKQVTDEMAGRTVVMIGCVSSVKFTRIRKEGKNQGREMAFIILSEDDRQLSVTVFPDLLEKDDKHGGFLRKIPPMAPLLLKGKIDIYGHGEERRLSIILDDARALIKTRES